MYQSYQISTDSEAMRAPVPVRAFVARRELPAEHLVCDLLRLLREHWVCLTRVDQQRDLRLVEVLLHKTFQVLQSASLFSMRPEQGMITHLEVRGDLKAGWM